MRALIEKARACGIRRILSAVTLDNPPSQTLHRKLGFDLTQRFDARLEL